MEAVLITKVIGAAILHLADCRDVLEHFPSAAAVVTDPPYGQALKNHAHGRARARPKKNYEIVGDADRDVGQSVIDWALKSAPSVIAFADPDRPWSGRWRSRLVWDKGPGVGGGGDPGTTFKQTWEMIQVWNAGKLQGSRDASVLKYYLAPWMFADHPAIKPVGLLAFLIGKVTVPGDMVIDPFMGSGSTGVAALLSGRRFIGVEREERHFNTACRRLEEVANQPNMFDPCSSSVTQASMFEGVA